jgi:acyl-CoA thioesterase FadM
VPDPFEAHRTRVREEWVDYNGHMNDAAYAVVLGEANEVLLDALGLSADYRDRTGAGLYTVESHLRYLAECTLGQVLTASTLLVAADARKVHLHTELLDEERRPAATGEYLYLHVDTHVGRTTPMPPDRQAAVGAMLAAHAALPRPAHLGRGISGPVPR